MSIEDILAAHTHYGFVIQSFINDARYVLITQNHGKISSRSPYFLKRFPSLKHSFMVEYEHHKYPLLLEPITLSMSLSWQYPFLNHLINVLCSQCIYFGICTESIYHLLYTLETTNFTHSTTIMQLFSDLIKQLFPHDKYVTDLASHEVISKKTLLIVAHNHSRDFKHKVQDLIEYVFEKELFLGR